MIPLTTITRLLVRMNRSKNQSPIRQATQNMTANQSTMTTVVSSLTSCLARKPER
jgi:hypothetical protein